MASYSQLLNTLKTNGYRSLIVGEEWTQGRTLFGGLVGALMYSVARHHVPQERLIRHIQITFVGPVLPDVEMQFDYREIRAGGSVTTVECNIIQNQEISTTMIASFGKNRESSLKRPSLPQTPGFSRDKIGPMQIVPGMPIPNFLQHYDVKWVRGGLPSSGVKDRDMGGVIQFSSHNENIEEAEVISLLDAWPPVALQSMTQLAPASTLNWSIQFVQDVPELPSDMWFQYLVTEEQAENGYSHSRSAIWTEDGVLLAMTAQTDVVFA